MPSRLCWSDAERAEITDELQRILDDSRFASSFRCTRLLQHVVLRVLDGDSENLKERTLGIQVFGRHADYDTSADPVVRVAASELRKRLAQYYGESDCSHSVRIHLAAGGYLPSFKFEGEERCVERAEPEAESPLAGHNVAGELSEAAPKRKASASWIKWTAICIGAAAVLASALLAVRFDFSQSTLELVWKPLLKTKKNVLVCVSDIEGSGNAKLPSNAIPSEQGSAIWAPPLLPHILLEDARTANRLMEQMVRLGGNASLKSASEVSLKDFRGSPLILVGGLNNPWSIKLLANLRFGVRVESSTGDRWIEDSQNPGNREWFVHTNTQEPHSVYAVLTRFKSAETGDWIMSTSGTGPLGSEAAAYLITAPAASNTLPDTLRTEKNFQVVMKATVVDRAIGSPQILVVHTW